MHLISIKLSGFKSFVDPTHMAFQSNLTAIVGPNGCGKSNIVDAIYCVLGSNSKNLRAEQMSDVIFNGTTSRPPVAKASIELIFDNSDNRIGGEYAKYPEISIRRELNRDGQSNYFLNGVRCRRRDITDLFLGTGLGNNNYAIIEQGMISRLIEAKPEELRAHVEEAAGTSKYKERRRETENRIKHTRENLERLNDLREELGKQLNHLQKQAISAEKYKTLKSEQRLIKAQLQAILWQNVHQNLESADNNIRSQETLYEENMAKLRQVDKDIEVNRILRAEKNEAVTEVQSFYYSLGSDINRIEQQINHSKERKKQLESDYQQLQKSYEEFQQQHFEDENQLQELTAEITQAEIKLSECKNQLEHHQVNLQIAEKKMQAWQEMWDDFNVVSANATKQMEVEKTKIHHLQQKHQALFARQQRIEEEQSSHANEVDAQKVTLLREEQTACQLQLETVEERLMVIQETLQLHRQQQQVAQNELTEFTKALRDLQAQNASMQAIQQIALGKTDTEVSHWLNKHSLHQQNRLVEELEVEAGWELAVETVLAHHLDAICIDDFSCLSNAVEEIQNADVGFFNLRAEEQVTISAVRLSALCDKVTSRLAMPYLLQSIYVADTLSEGLQHLQQLAPHESIVTGDGIWFSRQWMRIAKSKTEKTGILQREHDLKELQHKIMEQQAILAKKEALYQETQEKISYAMEEREVVQHELQIQKAKNSDLLAQIKAKQEFLQQLEQKNQRLNQEYLENKEQLQEVEASLEVSHTQLHSVNQSAIDEEAKRQHLLAEREQLRNNLDEVKQQSNHHRQTMDEFQIKFESLKNQIHYLNQNLARVQRQLSSTVERKTQLETALQTNTDPLPDLSRELQQSLEKRTIVEDELLAARQALEELESSLSQQEKARHDIEKNCHEIRSVLERMRVDCQALRVKMTTHVEQIQEANYIVEELIKDLPQGAQAVNWEESLIKIDNRIQRLGPINLAAIDECASLAERKQYLDQQHDDLVEALNTLENAIRKIDRETRIRFKETFEKLNESFHTYFKQIFGGGDANLELTSEDLLETGVMVKAQPPGKRNTTIHLLSGGEKALTAIALVFAIFNLNPAPFCVLDEVDAPLDDVNVGRFCHLVKKMSEKIQFIFISHNKIAIEMAKELAGVTMNEPGVSRLVSVDIEQAITMATA